MVPYYALYFKMCLLQALFLYLWLDEWNFADFLSILMTTLMLFFIQTEMFCFQNKKGSREIKMF